MQTTLHTTPAPQRQRAFTLAEVMVSMAMVLLIVYGVSQVFKMSSDTVGAQQALAAIVRDHRAAQATMSEDMKNCLPDSPLFLISSRIGNDGGTTLKAPWRNEEERQNDSDGRPFTTDQLFYVPALGQTNTIPPTLYLDRNPRLDRVAFFARSSFRRQTALDNQTIPITTGAEGFIWYGHTAAVTLDSSGNITTSVQPNNQFAADRVLGRAAVLMVDGATSGAYTADNSTTTLSPLSYNNPGFRVWQSRWDVADISIDKWRVRANGAYNFDANSWQKWYLPMDDDPGAGQFYRISCARAIARPFSAAGLARVSPYFLGNCTQFIVEYAGDFLYQNDASGDVPPTTPGGNKPVSAYMTKDPASNRMVIARGETDGKLDWIQDPSNGTRRIRWYGLPRDVTRDNIINIDDVVPLADVYEVLCGMPANTVAPHEKVLPANSLKSFGTTKASQDFMKMTNYAGCVYVCAWHNDAPMMIRVTLKIDDPAGRLQDGQWYEYVLSR